MNFRKFDLPEVEATPESMFAWAGYLFAMVIAASLAAVVLKLVVGFMALGAIACIVAGIVLTLKNRRSTAK